MAADVSSVARLLRGEAGKKGGPEIVTMDLLSSCGGGGGAAEDEVVDLKVLVPAGFERRLDLLVSLFFPLHSFRLFRSTVSSRFMSLMVRLLSEELKFQSSGSSSCFQSGRFNFARGGE